MRITTKIVFSMLTGEVLEHEFYEYEGPLALCDRGLQSTATNNAKTAGTTASRYGSSASDIGSTLSPFYNQELKTTHGFNPNQISELLTAAEAGGGGATGAIVGQANQEAARTRNASGFTKTLDEAARDKAKAAAGAGESIAAEDVMQAKKENQQGAEGLQGLYGTDVNAQLKAMGQQNEDINTAVKAGDSGWLQNTTAVLNALKGSGASSNGAGSWAVTG
jgi:hypothetical protein